MASAPRRPNSTFPAAHSNTSRRYTVHHIGDRVLCRCQLLRIRYNRSDPRHTEIVPFENQPNTRSRQDPQQIKPRSQSIHPYRNTPRRRTRRTLARRRHLLDHPSSALEIRPNHPPRLPLHPRNRVHRLPHTAVHALVQSRRPHRQP